MINKITEVTYTPLTASDGIIRGPMTERDALSLIHSAKQKLSEELSYIKDFSGIVVAGGRVVREIVNDKVGLIKSDVDVFFVKDDESFVIDVEFVQKKLIQLYVSLKKKFGQVELRQFNPNSVSFIARSENGLNPCAIHVILGCVFPSINVLLQLIDLSPCRFAFKNGSIYWTEGAMDFLTTGRFVVPDGYEERQSPMYGIRLKKYARLGKYYSKEVNALHAERERVFFHCYINGDSRKFNEWLSGSSAIRSNDITLERILIGVAHFNKLHMNLTMYDPYARKTTKWSETNNKLSEEVLAYWNSLEENVDAKAAPTKQLLFEIFAHPIFEMK
jgi:hypothetical protein